MNEIILDSDYRSWLINLKEKVRQTQLKASLSVNKELIVLYLNIGEQILEKQQHAKWGSNFLRQLSKDLCAEFPDISGFSKRNLELIRQWVLFYSPVLGSFAKQLVSQTDDSDVVIAKQAVSQTNDSRILYLP